jgi:hypothetical protein
MAFLTTWAISLRPFGGAGADLLETLGRLADVRILAASVPSRVGLATSWWSALGPAGQTSDPTGECH